MLRTIALFELKKRLGMLSTWVYFALFLALSFLLMIAAGGAFKSVSVGMGAGGKVFANSPYSLNQSITALSYFGLLVIAAVCGQAVHQDFEHGTSALFFTAPVGKRAYLGGRFAGALLVLFFIFSSIALGLFVGSKMPFLESTLMAPRASAWAYLQPYLVSVIPNLVFCGALFFALATLTRRMVPVYVGSVLLLIGYLLASSLTPKLENKWIAALLDPFGAHAIDHVAEYWSIAEKNARVVPLEGLFLWNRALWLGAAAALLALTFARFQPVHASGAEGGRAGADDDEEDEPAPLAPAVRATPQPASGLSLLPRLTWLALRETIKNTYFLVIVLCGVLFLIVTSRTAGAIFGTATHPVTYQVIELSSGSFTLFVLILITLYAGELTFRERDAKVDQLMDALPIPTWAPFLSRLLALIGMVAVLMVVVALASLGIQTAKGYFHYELGLYAKELFGLTMLRYSLLCVLAMTVQAIVNEKYVGHFLMVLYYLANAFAGRFGFEHHLYRYGSSPGHVYSDMNGFGHQLRAVLWFDAYWAAFAVALAAASTLFTARGVESGWRLRLRIAGARLRGPVRGVLIASLAAFACLGAFIFYNTNVLNRYRPRHQREQLQAEYETRYKALSREPQPRVTDVSVRVDLQPDKGAMRARGAFELRNQSDRPIARVIVSLPDELRIAQLSLGPQAAPQKTDARLGVHEFTLDPPLAPGLSTPLRFDVSLERKGFSNANDETAVVDNGTFFNSELLPRVGYNPNNELTDDTTRRNHGLAPKERMLDVRDPEGLKNSYFIHDADWVTFEATISTSPDQLAVAPGRLVREWTEEGRRLFTYRIDGKALDFWSVLSARYQVLKDRWSDVEIEIDYQKGHDYNLARMVKSIKASLDYFTKAFGPYQHKMVRIVEFPRYAQFAQSFPNTIPYSESIGFIAKVDPKDEEDVDYPYYVTSHEVAHQWWGHQAVGGDVQGATLLVETLAQYSSLMVMKQEYGAERMKRFLRYELNRYLQGRSFERKKELPLYRVENQTYLHYNKGSLAMYALQDAIGEERVNAALAAYLRRFAFRGPPYPNSLALLEELRKVTPPAQARLIEDLFETITLFDNRALSATARKRSDGKVEVTIEVAARKLRADELGAETEVPLDELVDVGALDEQGHVLLLEKRPLKAQKTEYSLLLDRMPAKAGIDPLNKLIDRRPDDNVIAVTLAR